MSSLLRRVPHFRLNFIRTFVKPHPETDPKANLELLTHCKYVDPKTRIEKEYRLLKMANNIRMVFISTSKEDDPKEEGPKRELSYFSIRVEVGSREDPETRLGLSHLLEHVLICASPPGPSKKGKTHFDHTVYHFSRTKYFWDTFKQISKFLFDPDSGKEITNDRIDLQRKLTDAEYHQSRTIQTNRRMYQIYKLNQIPMRNFEFGNNVTFAGELEKLISELKEHFKLYRKRPVFVYICSPLPMEVIEKKFKENFWIFENYKEEQRREPNAAIDFGGLEEARKTEFLLVKSDYEIHQLRILFPLKKNYSLLERNTITLFGHLVHSRNIRCIRDLLFEQKIAFNCEFVESPFGLEVTVDVLHYTEEYLKKIISTIRQCLNYILQNWERCTDDYFTTHPKHQLRDLKNLNCDVYMKEDINLFMNEEIDKDFFENFHGCLTSEEAKELYKDVIIDNQNVVYSILTQKPAKVLEEFGNPETTMVEEQIYKTQFYSVPHDIQPDSSLEGFKTTLPSLGRKFKSGKIRIAILVEDWRELAYQRLVAVKIKRYENPLTRNELLFRSDFEYHTADPTAGTINSLKKISSHMDECEFDFVKMYALRYLSMEMIQSLTLAKSLLTVAVQNSYLPSLSIEPIPMTYRQMGLIGCANFESYVNNSMKKSEQQVVHSPSDKACGEYLIKSINVNESITVTLIFIKTNESDCEKVKAHISKNGITVRDAYGIYTIKCSPVKISGIIGILLELHTVENSDLDSETARNKIIPEWVGEAYDIYKEKMICVQVKGYANTQAAKSFDETFEQWFEEHQPQFDKILNPHNPPPPAHNPSKKRKLDER